MHPHLQHALAKSQIADRHREAEAHRRHGPPMAARRQDVRPRRRPLGVLLTAWRWTR